MIYCKLCNKEYINLHALSGHISRGHKITIKSYYDKFLRSVGDGKCLVCKNPTTFNGLNGYTKFYSKQCIMKDPDIQKRKEKRTKQTCLEKYNVEYVFQIKEAIEKTKLTNIQKYGVDNLFKSKIIQAQIKKTNLKNLGFEYPAQSEYIKNKKKLTYLKNLGVDNPFKSEIVKEKSKQTIKQKYGVTNFSKTDLGMKISRLTHIKTVQMQKLNGEPIMPTIGSNERICLNELQKYTKYKIERNIQKIGYFPDGYIKELNLVIEFDERFHFIDNWITLSLKDQTREINLKQELNCNIFRIKEIDWVNKKEDIINLFKELIIHH